MGLIVRGSRFYYVVYVVYFIGIIYMNMIDVIAISINYSITYIIIDIDMISIYIITFLLINKWIYFFLLYFLDNINNSINFPLCIFIQFINFLF